MASLVTNEGALQLLAGTTVWSSATIKARLCTAGAFDKDDTVMTGKTAATGSTDVTLGTKTGPTKNTTDDRITYGCATISWTSLAHTGDATQIAIYRFVTNDADSVPIAYIDITDQSLTGATEANYAIPAAGLFYLQQ